MQRLQSVQLLRALAALMVVVYHVGAPGAVVGAAGVDIFFVISGLVMCIVTDLPNARPSTFAFDRLARILPLYWICTAVLAGASLALPKLFPSLVVTPAWLASSMMLVPFYEPGTQQILPVLAQGWTLAYEMLFYLILFGALFANKLWREALATATILILVILGGLRVPATAVGEVYTNPLLLEFLAGYWLGKLSKSGSLSPHLGLPLFALGIGGFIYAIISNQDPSGWLRLAVWGLPAFGLVAGLILLEPVVSRASAAPKTAWLVSLGALLGDASYAIYLTHGFAISIFRKIWSTAHMPLPHSPEPGLLFGVLHFCSAMAVCVALGILTHLTLERWILAKLRPFRPQSVRAM